MANIELRKLQHVAALARTGSFVKAAQELHLTQSALTRSVQSIEARFSIRLFDRDRSGVRLTAVGREFLRRAQPLLIEAEDLTRYLQRTGKGEIGHVAFGLSTLPAKLFLTPLMLHLFKEKQSIHCSVAVRDPDELLELLETDKIEFFLGTIVAPDRASSLEINELVQVRPTLMVRAGHPLLERSSLSIADLTAYPMLVSLFEPGPRGSSQFLADHPNTLLTDDYSSLLQITLASDAVWYTSMLPDDDKGGGAGLVRLPVEHQTDVERVTLKSVRVARRTLSPTAQEVLSELRKRCARPGERA